jgi:hypothetical protein
MPRKASLALALAIVALAAWAIWAAWGWPLKAKLFPLAIGIPMLVLAAAEVVWALRVREPDGDPEPVGRTLVAAAWMVGFFAAILLVGFLAAVPLFVLAYLRLQGRESWTLSVVFTAVVWGVFYGLFDRMLHLPFPAGYLIAAFTAA